MEERNGVSFYFHDEITFYYAKLLLRIQLVFEFCKKHPFTLGAAVESVVDVMNSFTGVFEDFGHFFPTCCKKFTKI